MNIKWKLSKILFNLLINEATNKMLKTCSKENGKSRQSMMMKWVCVTDAKLTNDMGTSLYEFHLQRKKILFEFL